MSRQVVSLNGDAWSFGQVRHRAFTAANVYDLPAVAEWLPATAPGNVRTDLLVLGRIPDPFENEQHKVSLWAESVDWWYRRAVQIAPLEPLYRAFLVFDGIDYRSALFVNEQEMARHEGMFSRQVVEITGLLGRRGDTIELAARLWGSSALPRRRLNRAQRLWQKVAGKLYNSWVGVYPDRTATLKCQMSFGWDFAPPIRTMGIWDDVSLWVTGPVVIEELGVRSWELGDGGERGSGGLGESKPPASRPFQLHLSLTLDSLFSTAATATVTVTPANFEGKPPGPFRFPLHLPAGRSDLTLRCALPAIERWQPWDRGFPHLYDVTVALVAADGAPLDSASQRTGFRTVTQAGVEAKAEAKNNATNPSNSTNATNPSNSTNSINSTNSTNSPNSTNPLNSWRFIINDEFEFMRGLNWVPADSFPGRLRWVDYERLLVMARDSGANLLRVWGGGLREKQAFYDLCDELGLLVWQEFPFACEFLGAFPRDAAYLDFVADECGAIVRRLRHHPALLLWCGGNEFSRLRNLPLLRTLAGLVRRYDGTRLFVPVSPNDAHGGDAHNWHVWHGGAPFSAYRQETAAFLSEFGLQALPDSMRHEKLATRNLAARKADVEKLLRYARLFNDQLSITNYELSKKRDEAETVPSSSAHSILAIYHSQFTIHKSQLAQAIALQTAIEHMRRRKHEAGGLCLWQFNEPWPAVSWAIVDYHGQPKLAYERLKTWYNPILASLDFPAGRRWQAGDLFQADIWLINDSLHAIANATLQITLTTVHKAQRIPRNSQFAIRNLLQLAIPANSAACVGRVEHRFATSPQWLTATLRRGDELLSENHYPLAWHDDRRGSVVQRLRRWVAGWVLR